MWEIEYYLALRGEEVVVDVVGEEAHVLQPVHRAVLQQLHGEKVQIFEIINIYFYTGETPSVNCEGGKADVVKEGVAALVRLLVGHPVIFLYKK